MKKLFILIFMLIGFSIHSQTFPTSCSEVRDEPKKEVSEKSFVPITKIITDSVKKITMLVQIDSIKADTVLLKSDIEVKLAKDIVDQNLVIQKQEKNKSLPPKPEQGSKPIVWLDYFIAILSIFILWAISWIKKLETIQNPIIQRLISETSTFIKRIQVICGTISVIIPILLSMDIFGTYWVSIFQNVEVAVLAIVGFSLFTTKKPELQK